MCRIVYLYRSRGGGNLRLAPQWFKVNSHSEGAYPKESSQLLKGKAGLLRQKSRNVRFGFTLAEVLITLGVIGVVAALTLPSVINKFKVKQLETAFKKSSAVLENNLISSLSEYSLEHMAGKKGASDQLSTVSNSERATINDLFAEKLKIINVATIKAGACANQFTCELISKNKLYDYSGNLVGKYSFNNFSSAYDHGQSQVVFYLLFDGSAIGQINFQHHGPKDGVKVTIDTNGPFKGPNRYGYDIFDFDSGNYWSSCCGNNKSGCPSHVFYGCYNYAKANQNPSDSSKGYWESLYK